MRRIVVLGGGFCGLNAVLQLQEVVASRSRVELVLVEPNPQFVFTPLLTDVCSGASPAHRATVPYRQVIDEERVRWIRDRATSLDPEQQVLQLQDNGPLDFDSLLVAVGADVIPNPEVVADPADVVTLHSLEDALRIRSILRERETPGHIVVVGGGCVGVEFAASLMAQAHAGSALVPTGTRMTVVEKDTRLVPDMDESLSGEAYRSLLGWGATVELHTAVTRVAGKTVELSDGRALDADLVLWAGGVSPSAFSLTSQLPMNEAGRVIVGADLRVPGCGELYVAGDLASVDGVDPQRRIDVALQSARVAAGNINAGMVGRARLPYEHRDGVEVLDLGGRRAAAVYQGVTLRGRMAWGVRHLALAAMAPSLSQKLALASDLGASILGRSARLLRGNDN